MKEAYNWQFLLIIDKARTLHPYTVQTLMQVSNTHRESWNRSPFKHGGGGAQGPGWGRPLYFVPLIHTALPLILLSLFSIKLIYSFITFYTSSQHSRYLKTSLSTTKDRDLHNSAIPPMVPEQTSRFSTTPNIELRYSGVTIQGLRQRLTPKSRNDETIIP